MNIQLNKIILWSKKYSDVKKEIVFSPGKLNIIHGASQTGKSAIISIIDYCLCSSKYSIPVGIIRDKVSWFGILLIVDDKKLFIARENKSRASKFHFEIGTDIDIPVNISSNEENMQILKEKINNLLGIPFFQLNKFTPKGNRPSFRDLVTFNFQPQNIVANANCLLYKTDIAEYRDRIREIFNFAIGVETGKFLSDKQLYQTLTKKIEELKNEKHSKKILLEKELLNKQDFILTSMKYGLLDKNDYVPENIEKIICCLKKITKNDLSNIQLSIDGENNCLIEQQKIMSELKPLIEELRNLQISKRSLKEIISLADEQQLILNKQKNKLNLSKFLKDFSSKHMDDLAVFNINKLYSSLEKVEHRIRNEKFSKNSIYEKKLADIDNGINELQKQINEKLNRYKILQSSLDNKNIIEDYLQQIVEAKTLLNFYNQDLSNYDEQISKYEKQLPHLANIKERLRIALNDIRNNMQNYKPTFSEFNFISQFDTKNLTVKIAESLDANDFYLWETGSGSNWVAYHLAALLGFHIYFINHDCPVFNFVVFDQPTQVYFPTAIYDEQKQLYVFNQNTSDYKNVEELYSYMNKAVIDGKGKFQIIVLDHTDESIWGQFKTINTVSDWSDRKKDALIPRNW